MNKSTSFILAFVGGVVVGAATSMFLLKDRYEKEANDEIEELRNFYLEKTKKLKENDSEKESIEEKPIENDEKPEYNKIAYANGYYYSDVDSERNGDMRDNKPYVITPDEFGEKDDYETNTLIYYKGNGIVADEEDIVVDNVDEVIGSESLNHFGEYEDDSVFVRNDRHECDYEILLDNGKFEG